jgi:ATP-dependent helicase/nuclease subunit A
MSATDPTRSFWVEANAGSGKTTTLTRRVARLLLSGADPGHVLCVTFTKTAAAEMQDRLFDTLGKWSVMPDAKLREELEKIGETPGEDLSMPRRLFARALETPGGLRIQTIHAFCTDLLKRFPFEADVSPGFETLEDVAHAALIEREWAAFRERLAPEETCAQALTDLAFQLSPEGFDKLPALLVRNHADALSWLAQRAGGCRETARRQIFETRGLTEDDCEQVLMRRIEESALRSRLATWCTLLTVAKRSKVEPLIHLGDADTVIELFDEITSEWKKVDALPRLPLTKRAQKNPGDAWGGPEKYHRVLDELTEHVRWLLSLRAAGRSAGLLALTLDWGAHWAEALRSRGALGFDDLVRQARDVLSRDGGVNWVNYKLDQTIRHILVDEAQDTSPAQWAVLRPLLDEITAGAGAEYDRLDNAQRTAFVVGDPKQSIFSFQGADIDEFKAQRGKSALLEDFALTESFRSVPEILELADRVCGATGDDAFRDVRHVSNRAGKAHAGCAELWSLFLPDDKGDAPEPWDAPRDTVPETHPAMRLARVIAAEIRNWIEQGERVYDRTAHALRPMRWGDVLILVRKRRDVYNAINRALLEAGIPTGGADLIKLKDAVVVRDLCAALRITVCPDDCLALAELLRSPLLGWTSEQLEALCLARQHVAHSRRLFEQLEAEASHADAPAHVREAHEFLTHLRAAWSLGDVAEVVSAALEHLFEEPDGQRVSGRRRFAARLGTTMTEPLEEFLTLAHGFAARACTGIEGFLDEILTSDIDVKREPGHGDGGVRVMTVHGAKGLEAPVVILPDTVSKPKSTLDCLQLCPEKGPCWMPASQGEDDDVAGVLRERAIGAITREELRMLYVALTRPRDRIVICGAKNNTKQTPPECFYERVRPPFEAWAADTGIASVETHIDIGRTQPETVSVWRIGTLHGSGAAEGPTAALEASALPAWVTERPNETAAERRGFAAGGGRGAALTRLAGVYDAASAFAEERRSRGTLLHLLLQHLPAKPADRRESIALEHLRRNGIHDVAVAHQALAILNDPHFGEVFGPHSRAEVPISGVVDGPLGPERRNGRIDRLVLLPDRTVVVDFKSNLVVPGRPEDAPPDYIEQLAVYRALLQKARPGMPVECAFIWSEGPLLMPVPAALMDAAMRGAVIEPLPVDA